MSPSDQLEHDGAADVDDTEFICNICHSDLCPHGRCLEQDCLNEDFCDKCMDPIEEILHASAAVGTFLMWLLGGMVFGLFVGGVEMTSAATHGRRAMQHEHSNDDLNLHDSFDSLSVTVLRMKANHDALLAACKAVSAAATEDCLIDLHDITVAIKQARAAIKAAEGDL